MAIDGFYTGYFTGTGGNGLAILVFKDGALVGADAAGVRFDGNYVGRSNGEGYSGQVAVKVPPNTTLVQGATSGPSGMEYSMTFSVPENFLEQPYLKLETAIGPVNLKLQKLREI